MEWGGDVSSDGVADVIAHRVGHSGDAIDFRLRISVTLDPEPKLVVRESRTRPVLPFACPETHINRDGSFCLGRGGLFFALPGSVAEATVWWGNLGGYLGHQIIAGLSGRWPKGFGWAHGRAAEIEEALERHEHGLPPLVADSARRASVGGPLPPVRAPCPCGSGRKFGHCHGPQVATSLALRAEVIMAERQYAAEWDRPCCGTMRNCPVRRPLSQRRDRPASILVQTVLSDAWPMPGAVDEGGMGGAGMRLLRLPVSSCRRRSRPAPRVVLAHSRPNRAQRRAAGRHVSARSRSQPDEITLGSTPPIRNAQGAQVDEGGALQTDIEVPTMRGGVDEPPVGASMPADIQSVCSDFPQFDAAEGVDVQPVSEAS